MSTTPVSRTPRLSTIILLAVTSVITLNLFLPALADIADDFSVSQALMSWAFSGYLLVTATLQLLLGPLSDRIGRRPVVLVGVSVFTLASLCAALAPTVELFFLARFTQGAIIAGMVLSQAIVRDISVDAKDAARRLASVAMIMALGPLVAPMLGGTLADLFGWRSNFLFLSLFGVMILALCWFDLNETNKNPSTTFASQFKAYPVLLSSVRFWGYALSNAFSVGMFFAFLVAMPLVGRAQFGLNNTTIGLLMGALPVGYIIGNSIVRSKGEAWGIARFMLYGRIVAVLSTLPSLALLWLGVSGVAVFLPLAFVGLANGFAIPTSNAGIVSINPRIAGSAAGLTASLSLLVGATVSALTAALLEGTPTAVMMLGILFVIALIGVPPTLMVWQRRHLIDR